MDRLLARLERRFGKYAVENLTSVIVGGMGLALILSHLQPGFEDKLTFEPHLVAQGQVWRLVTFLFLPPPTSLIFAVFALMITWTVGSGLEAAWGAFKFNLFYIVGMLGTIAAAFISGGGASNVYLNLSLFLAFATVYPDYEFRMFFFFPMKVKWLALIDAAFLAYTAAESDWAVRAAIIAAIGNYLLFFSGRVFSGSRGRVAAASSTNGRGFGPRPRTETGASGPLRSPRSVPPPAVTTAGETMGQRVCAICGTREDEGADIRVCNCEKCGGVTRNLCLAHARSH